MRSVVAFAYALLAGSALSLGCGPAPHSRGAGAVSPLTVRSVAWNPAATPIGAVRAVADAGDVVAVFSDRGATVFSARSAVTTDTAITDWAGADAIAGADGAAQWILGVTSKGRMYHLRGLSAFEDVTDRYGLGTARVLGATTLGEGYVGFLLGSEIAIADGGHVTRYPSSADGVTFAELAGGGGYGAGVARDRVRVFDLARKAITEYPLPDVTHAAIGPDGRLYATTPRAVYAADALGRLSLVYDATADTIHGLVASGAQVWFADGGEIGVVAGDHVAETSGAKIPPDAKLSSSASGDVWVFAGTTLDRFARAETTPSPAGDWGTAIAPIFSRACAACHLPGGISGTDLSTAAAWETERAHIHDRVIDRRSMPPQGHPLADTDCDAIKAWLEAAPN